MQTKIVAMNVFSFWKILYPYWPLNALEAAMSWLLWKWHKSMHVAMGINVKEIFISCDKKNEWVITKSFIALFFLVAMDSTYLAHRLLWKPITWNYYVLNIWQKSFWTILGRLVYHYYIAMVVKCRTTWLLCQCSLL